jgi:hypothetical protein
MPPLAGLKDVFTLSQTPRPATRVRGDGWLRALRRYLLATAALDLVWEAVQLPLYTIWHEGTAREKAFAVLHCTAGDLIIALLALVGALVVAGDAAWPAWRRGRVAALTLAGGLAYTVFSEWLNVESRRSWAYSGLMPILPPFGTGLSPVLQWLIVPALALRAAHRAGAERST